MLFELAGIARRLLSVHRVDARCVKRKLAFHLRLVRVQRHRMQRHISFRERARGWNLAPMCRGMSKEMLLLVASFTPLAGARMICTCRRSCYSVCTGHGSYAVCDNLLQSLSDERGLRSDYLSAMWRFLRANKWQRLFPEFPKGHVPELEELIAAVAELGGDADLVFALALILQVEVSDRHGERVYDYWGDPAVCDGRLGPPLFAACGPKGSNAVVSLLLRLGAPVGGRKVYVAEAYKYFEYDSEIKLSALWRAVRLQKHSTVCMLLRASALAACKGRDFESRKAEVGAWMWCSALFGAAAGGHVGIAGALLEARACPSRTNIVRHNNPHDVEKLSAWEFTHKGRALGAFVLEAFLACERRCCCKLCKGVFKCRDYR